MSIPQLPPLPDVPRERRGAAGLVAFGVLGALCLLGLVLGLRGLLAPADGEPTAGTGAATTASATAEGSVASASTPSSAPASPSASATPQDAVQFASPSGNIRCVLSTTSARCDITERDWDPPAKPAACHQQWGDGVQVDNRAASLVCSDERVDGGQALEYGDSLTRGDFRCDSDEDGVSCRHIGTGHGFTLSRAAYHLT